MARKVTIPKKDHETLTREAAKAAAREAILEFQKAEDEGPSDELFSELDSSNETISRHNFDSNNQTSSPVIDNFDLFDYCDDLQSKGTLVQYTIKKNSILIASGINHPLSWDMIMKKYGEGLYQVMAKNVATKKFIKSQTQMLGSPVLESPSMDDQKEAKEESESSLGIMEMMTLLDRKSQEAKREAREEAMRMAEIQEKSQNTMMTLITALVSNKQNSGPSQAEIQLQTMQMMNQMFDKMQASTNAMIEKLTNKIERVAEASSQKKDDGPSWADVMKMTVEAQNKGFDMWTKLEELAEKKAEEKIELIEEYRSESDTKEVKPESATDSLIKTILPTVVSALAGQNNQQAINQNQQMLTRQQAQARQQQMQNQARLELQKKREAEIKSRESLKKEVTKTLESSIPVSVLQNTNGLPKVSFDDELVSPKSGIKEKCLEILPSFLGQMMMAASQNQVDLPGAARGTVLFLLENGITEEEFLANVKSQDLVDVGTQYNLPNEAISWLNELYAHIQNQSSEENRTDVGGESSPGLS